MERPMFEFAEILKVKCDTLGREKLIVFVLSCCERQLPVYLKGCSGYKWTEPHTLRKNIDLGWKYIEGGDQNLISDANADDCDDCAPSDPVASGDAVSADVAYSIASAMAFIANGKIRNVLDVSTTSFNMLDSLIYAVLGLEIGSRNDYLVDENKLMIRELEHQKNDLAELENSTDFLQCVSLLRERSNLRSLFDDLWYPNDY